MLGQWLVLHICRLLPGMNLTIPSSSATVLNDKIYIICVIILIVSFLFMCTSITHFHAYYARHTHTICIAVEGGLCLYAIRYWYFSSNLGISNNLPQISTNLLISIWYSFRYIHSVDAALVKNEGRTLLQKWKCQFNVNIWIDT